jgi:kumamolisin
MRYLIVHCTNGKEDKAKIMKRLEKVATLNSYGHNNPHSIGVKYHKTNKPKVKRVLKRYSKRIVILKRGHPIDGKLKTHLRMRKDAVSIKDDDKSGVLRENYGNLPPQFATYYSYPAQQGSVAPKIAVISLGGTFLTTDLSKFWTTYLGQTGTPNVTYVNGIDGSTNKSNSKIKNGDGSDENTLDLEIIIGTCPKAHVTMYFGTNTLVGFYDAFATAIASGTKIISCSWGSAEAGFGTSYLNAYNQLFESAALAGCTISIAAGDNGSTDGTNALALDFPSSSPYVVSCGGTSVPSLSSSNEVVWHSTVYNWGTGGGLSSHFTSNRSQVVYPTLNTTTPSVNSLITSHSRSSPDIALNADPLFGYSVYYDGSLIVSGYGGTSCVAPMMSGFFGLLNKTFTSNPCDKLYAAYNNSNYKDITSGTNDNLAHSTNVYVARSGFDQCSGMGAINGHTLSTYLLAN